MEIITGILLLIGSVFILLASVGVLRFRDTYSRMHATTKASSFGLLLIISGVTIYFFSLILLLKALFVVGFIYLTAPLAAQSISQTLRDPKE